MSISLKRIGDATLYGRLPATRIGPAGRCFSSQSDSRKSPSTTVRLRGAVARSAATRSRSISNAVTTRAADVNGPVSAARPGPISMNSSSAAGAIAFTTFTTQAGSRKCWPKRLRAIIPVLLFDLFDLLLAHAEVMADLVNECFGDRHDEIVFVVGFPFVRALEEQDAIGQAIAVVPAALGKRRTGIQPKQRARRTNAHLAQQFARGLVFDDDRDVLHRVAKAARNRGERVSDEAFELFALHLCSRRPCSSRTRRARRTCRTTAWAGRRGGRAESACRTFASSEPSAWPRTAVFRPEPGRHLRRCRYGC